MILSGSVLASQSIVTNVQFQQIWKAIVIQDTPDGQCISPETFLPGLRSRHRSTLDFTATLWNRHFGRRSDVIYSEAVSQALGRAGKVTKLLTPGIFPSSKVSLAGTQTLH